MQLRSRRQLVVLACVAVLVVTGALILLMFNKNPQLKSRSSDRYTDPLSHQTVSNPQGKTPDIYGSNSDTPVYLGFDKLIDHGLSFDQLNNIKTAFYSYSKKQGQPFKEISVDVDHISLEHDPKVHNSPLLMLFDVQFDRKEILKAKIDYSKLSSVRLYLINPANDQVVYDSQVINTVGGD